MNQCRVCGWEGNGEEFVAREMMIPTRDEFVYFSCPKCNCLQIREVPDNLGDYYGHNYYSYSAPSNTGRVETEKREETRVLDVGCGAGSFLCGLAQSGFVNLVGCDPFIEKELHYENGVDIYKKSIHEMDGKFDWIYLSDSFEHMEDPNEVMESIHRLLSDQGIARLRLPVYPNIAFEQFGTNWYQLDAPRHIILHSKQSLSYLAEKHHLSIVKKEWDSNNSQFVRSFLYTQNIPFKEQEKVIGNYFNEEAIEEMNHAAVLVNQQEYGDHAVFYFAKND